MPLPDGLRETYLDATKSLLGTLMIEPSKIPYSRDSLGKRPFFEEKHNAIYEACLELEEEGRGVDAVTVAEKLEEDDKLGMVGGSSNLAEMINVVPSTEHHREYIEAIQRFRERVNIEKIREEYDPWDTTNEPSEIADSMKEDLSNIHEVTQGVDTLSDFYGDLRGLIDSAEDSGFPEDFIRTGWKDLDFKLNAIAPTDFIIVIAESGVGKTTFCLNLVNHICQNEGPALIWSGEMQGYELAMKMIACEFGINMNHMMRGNLEPDEEVHLDEARDWVDELPFLIGRNISDIYDLQRTIRDRNEEHDLSVVLVDYLQFLDDHLGGAEDDYGYIDDISKKLMSLTNEIEVPIIAISRTNYEGNVYGSSGATFDCNYKIKIDVDWQERNGERVDDGTRNVFVEKARLSEGGGITMQFDKETSQFFQTAFGEEF